MLTGYKTYIVAVLMVVLSILKSQGLIDTETFIMVLGVLNGAGFATLRSGVKKDTE